MKVTKLSYFILICSSLLLASCSCNPEKIFEMIANSSMFKGQGEVMAIGGFSRIESHFQKDFSNDSSRIELKLFDGKLPELYENEANIARKCAKTYIEASESEDYYEIEVFIIKTDEQIPSQTIYQSNYTFEVASLVDK